MKTESQRIVALEEQVAHLQRLCDVLNEVITQQTMKFDRLEKRVAKWEQKVENLNNKSGEVGDPLDEKPPHY